MRAHLLAAIAAAGALGCGSRTPLDVDETPCIVAPATLEVELEVGDGAADVAFVVDVTASMGEEIAALQTAFGETVVPAVLEAVPDATFSVSAFTDFPFPPYGSERDVLFEMLTPQTPDVAVAAEAFGALTMGLGGDGPEAHVEALYQVATGTGRTFYPGHIPPAACPEGTDGCVCFRRDARRVVVLVTDAAMHSGPGGDYAYDATSDSPDYAQALAALRAASIRAAGVWSGLPEGPGRAHLVTLARDTGALSPAGEPLVIDVGRDGDGIETRVAGPLSEMLGRLAERVELVVEDVPGDAVDARPAVVSVEAVAAEPPSAGAPSGSGFSAVRFGATLRFRLALDPAAVGLAASGERLALHLRLVTPEGETVGERPFVEDICAEGS